MCQEHPLLNSARYPPHVVLGDHLRLFKLLPAQRILLLQLPQLLQVRAHLPHHALPALGINNVAQLRAREALEHLAQVVEPQVALPLLRMEPGSRLRGRAVAAAPACVRRHGCV